MIEITKDMIGRANLTNDQQVLMAIGDEIVSAIKSLRQFSGDLNEFRILPADLRNLAIQMIAADVKDIGLEDLLHSIRTIARK